MFIPNGEEYRQAESKPPYFKLTRREFNRISGTAILGMLLKAPQLQADATAAGLPSTAGGRVEPSLFIAIHADGTIDLTCHRSEMGQQIWTAMAQILAEELEADWTRVRVVQAEGHPRYGDQNTDGSRSIRWNFHRLRLTGGAVRVMLERAAAARWSVPAAECRAEQHNVIHQPSGRRLSYGELAPQAAKLELPTEAEIRLKPRSQWRYINRKTASLTTPKIIRGKSQFGIDVQLPDMVHAVIARPPQVFGKLRKADTSLALKVPGVLSTLDLPLLKPPALFKPLGGIAVIATDTWAAIQGRRALKLEWEEGPNADYDTDSFIEDMRHTAHRPGTVRRNRGDTEIALQKSEKVIEADYVVPHLSQSPMEPPVATARWNGDHVECWACVQAPQSARTTVAAVCGIPEEHVTIHVTWLGGAFGRKSKADFVAEAALLARQAGRPVKVTWTREDDIQHGFYHSVSVQHLKGGLDAAGTTTAILHRTVFPSISSTFSTGETPPSWGEMRMGASDTPFATPNLRLESGYAASHLRIGWLRSVSNIQHAFAVQSFAHELAAAAGRDPKDYLLALIGPPRLVDPRREGVLEYDNYGSPLADYPIDTGRLRQAIETAANMAEWGREMPAGHGLGIAVHRSFVSYVATVIEVRVDAEGRLTIPGIWSAIDAGTVVNPGHVKAQVEGGTIYGLSNALYGEITVTGGRVEQANFPQWRIMRMAESPRAFETAIIESEAPPGGVGEPPTPPAAPALANAIFAATGIRFRQLPILGSNANRLIIKSAG